MPADGPQQLYGCCVHANRRIRYNRKDLKTFISEKGNESRGVGPITFVLVYDKTLLGLPRSRIRHCTAAAHHEELFTIYYSFLIVH